MRSLLAAGVCVCLVWCTHTAAVGAEVTPQKHSLSVPVAIAGKPAGSVQCVVTAGPVVPVAAVAFSPDGKTLAAAGYGEVLIWDLENAKLAKRLGTGELGTCVTDLALLQEGKLLAVAAGTPQASGVVKLYDIETGKSVWSWEEAKDVVYALAVSPDGKLLVVGGPDGAARVWNVADKKLLKTLEGHSDWILDVAFSQDGKALATAGADRNTLVWDTATWELPKKLREDDAVQGVAFGSDARMLVVAVGGPNQQSLVMRRQDNERYRRPISTGGGMPLGAIWTGKANMVYVPCSDGAVRVFQSYGRLMATLAGHEDWVYCVDLSPDQTKIASGSGDGTVRLWEAAKGGLLATLVQLAPQTDDWLIVTSKGPFTASSADSLKWETDGAEAPPKEVTDGLDAPDKVRAVIWKEETTGAAKQAKPQPKRAPKQAKRQPKAKPKSTSPKKPKP